MLSPAEQRAVKRTDPCDWRHICRQRVFHSSLNLHNFDCVSGILRHLTWTATAGFTAGYSATFTSLTRPFKASKFRQFTLPSLPPTGSFFLDLKLSTLLSPSLPLCLLLCSSLPLCHPALSPASSPSRVLQMNVSAAGRACGTVWKTGNELYWDKVLSDRAWIEGTEVNYKLLTRCLVS